MVRTSSVTPCASTGTVGHTMTRPSSATLQPHGPQPTYTLAFPSFLSLPFIYTSLFLFPCRVSPLPWLTLLQWAALPAASHLPILLRRAALLVCTLRRSDLPVASSIRHLIPSPSATSATSRPPRSLLPLRSHPTLPPLPATSRPPRSPLRYLTLISFRHSCDEPSSSFASTPPLSTYLASVASRPPRLLLYNSTLTLTLPPLPACGRPPTASTTPLKPFKPLSDTSAVSLPPHSSPPDDKSAPHRGARVNIFGRMAKTLLTFSRLTVSRNENEMK